MSGANTAPQRPSPLWMVATALAVVGMAIASVVDPRPVWICGVLLYTATGVLQLRRWRSWQASRQVAPASDGPRTRPVPIDRSEPVPA